MLALPLLPSMMLANSAAAIIQFRAAELGEGAVAIYGYASRLHGALAQILVIGLSTVLLPHFAALWSRGENAEITIVFRRLARCTILVVAYLTGGIFLMGETATGILFERGVFDAQHSQQVSWLWDVVEPVAVPGRLWHFHRQVLPGRAGGRQHPREQHYFLCCLLERNLVRRIAR